MLTIYGDGIGSSPIREKRKVEWEMTELLKREEIMWRQRSRVDWLREGDKKPNFFHQRASQRKARNTISSLRDEAGAVVNDKEQILAMARDFYEQLFKSANGTDPKSIMHCIQPSVSAEMNEVLMAELTIEEIQKALFQMGPWKADPDHPIGWSGI